ncbi:MAG: lipase secretion chaperone [Alcanivorax sp.]|nr:lipase secretion chaperone [Alcanivorax sp.]
MRKRTLVTFLILIQAIVFFGIVLAPPPVSAPGQDAPVLTPAAPALTAGKTVTAAASLPLDTPSLNQRLANTSLAGTTPPAHLTTDSKGNLLVSSTTKDVLDYFLALQGELPAGTIRKILRQWATTTAGHQAAKQLLSLLDRYREYGKQFASGEFTPQGMDDVEEKLRLRQQLRDDIFGSDTAAALFAEDDRYDRFSLQRHHILTSNLSDADKSAALQQLRSNLPTQLAEQYQQQYALRHLEHNEKVLQQQGADDNAVFAYDQQTFGDQAALRLKALKERRTQWQQRYHDYADQRDAILHAGLARQDQQQQLQQLRERLFTGTEQQRVAALDRIHQQQQSAP